MPSRIEVLRYLHDHQKEMPKEDYEYYWNWYRQYLLAEVMLDELYKKMKGDGE